LRMKPCAVPFHVPSPNLEDVMYVNKSEATLAAIVEVLEYTVR
jgi:hypothetical protein